MNDRSRRVPATTRDSILDGFRAASVMSARRRHAAGMTRVPSRRLKTLCDENSGEKVDALEGGRHLGVNLLSTSLEPIRAGR
jgi:hypothetical protein